MFRILGQLICRAPGIWIILWCALAVFTFVFAPDEEQLSKSEPASLLPEDAKLNVAMRLQAQAFPDQAARSNVVLVFHRAAGLTPADQRFLSETTSLLAQEGRQGREPWRVLSGSESPALRLRLSSSDQQAAMIVVNLDVNFVTRRATAAVDHIEELVRPRLPQGLTLEITGSAGIGKEHNSRSRKALDRTTKVTIAAVLIILALVYRSPLGALVPLCSIGLSVLVAFKVLDFLASLGWPISEAERTFTVVLLFGAGTDYALFWISRYREELSRGSERAEAAIDAMTYVGPAILASAGTTILGLMMLISADMVIINTSGKVLGIVLTISLLAAITLTPAMAVVMGNALFWPGSPIRSFSIGQRFVWQRVGAGVVRRPWTVLVCGLVVIGIPAVSACWIPLRYDSFGEVAKGSSAERGLLLAKKHFSEDELFSTRFLIQSASFDNDSTTAGPASAELAAQLAGVEGVSDVWHLVEPLGRRRGPALPLLFAVPAVQSQVSEYYFAADYNILQLEVMQQHPPLSLEALQVLGRMKDNIELWAKENLDAGYDLYAIGQTPYIADVKAIADRDLVRVIWLVTSTIWVIVLLLIRRLWLTICMLIATLITYGAALGLTGWVFVDLLGREGVDYKIRILVFVIIVAVGQDYNIFLVTRMLHEIRSYEIKEAISRSIVLTGPVISSCGLIMAATLGSLCTTGIDLTEQLGFAFAAGVLIDTFLVRPLLMPSIYLIIERRWPAKSKSPLRKPAPTAPPDQAL